MKKLLLVVLLALPLFGRGRVAPIPIQGPFIPTSGFTVTTIPSDQYWLLTVKAETPQALPFQIPIWRYRAGKYTPVPITTRVEHFSAYDVPTSEFVVGDLVGLQHMPGLTIRLTIYGPDGFPVWYEEVK